MENKYLSDHLANERTFLSWIRTSIAIKALGFVVVKFSLFVRQFSILLNKDYGTNHPHGYSAIMGVVLVAAGIIITILAFIRYRRNEQQISSGSYHNSSAAITFISAFLVLTSILLVVYLTQSA